MKSVILVLTAYRRPLASLCIFIQNAPKKDLIHNKRIFYFFAREVDNHYYSMKEKFETISEILGE